jgi:chromosome segregation ATPase
MTTTNQPNPRHEGIINSAIMELLPMQFINEYPAVQNKLSEMDKQMNELFNDALIQYANSIALTTMRLACEEGEADLIYHKGKVELLTQENESLRAELEMVKAEIKKLKESNEDFANQYIGYNERIYEAEATIEKLNEDMNIMDDNCARWILEVNTLKADNESLRAELEKVKERELNNINRAYNP